MGQIPDIHSTILASSFPLRKEKQLCLLSLTPLEEEGGEEEEEEEEEDTEEDDEEEEKEE